jgi:hypothetical protein
METLLHSPPRPRFAIVFAIILGFAEPPMVVQEGIVTR